MDNASNPVPVGGEKRKNVTTIGAGTAASKAAPSPTKVRNSNSH